MEDIFKTEKHEQYTHKQKPIFDAYGKTRMYMGKMFENEENSKKLQKDAKKVLTEA